MIEHHKLKFEQRSQVVLDFKGQEHVELNFQIDLPVQEDG